MSTLALNLSFGRNKALHTVMLFLLSTMGTRARCGLPTSSGSVAVTLHFS